MYDVIALGCQESTYHYSPKPKFEKEKEKEKDGQADCIADLRDKIMNILGDDYEIVEHNRRAQMQLFVIVRCDLVADNTISKSKIEMNAENTGLLGIFPNKGGLFIGMEILSTRIAFISCHLAAHEGVDKCTARNNSISEILGGVRARDIRYDILANYHHIFWMGDLNYRLTFSKSVPKRSSMSSKPQGPVPGLSPHQQSQGQDEEPCLEDEEDGDQDQDQDEGYSIAASSPIPSLSASSARRRLQSEDTEGDGDDNDIDIDIDDINEDSQHNSNSSKRNKQIKRSKERDRVFDMIQHEQWSRLLDLDELTRELASGRIFSGFVAAAPAFPPTFKRTRHLTLPNPNPSPNPSPNPRHNAARHSSILGSDDPLTDTPAPTLPLPMYYDSKRLPSYTDRILHRSWPGFLPHLLPSPSLPFSSCEYCTSSDHKPVRAGFLLLVTSGIPAPVHVPTVPVHVQRMNSSGSSSSDMQHMYNPHLLRMNSNTSNTSNYSLESSSSSRTVPVHASPGPGPRKKRASIFGLPGTRTSSGTVRTGAWSLNRMHVTLSRLSALDLVEMDSALSGGLSDPFIVLSTDPVHILTRTRSGARGRSLSSTGSWLGLKLGDLDFSGCMKIGLGKSNKLVRDNEIKSSVVYHDINPVWKDELHATIACTDIDALSQNAHFVISVWDADAFKNDEVIGVCLISFRDLLKAASEDRPYDFSEQLLHQGVARGVLRGSICIHEPFSALLANQREHHSHSHSSNNTNVAGLDVLAAPRLLPAYCKSNRDIMGDTMQSLFSNPDLNPDLHSQSGSGSSTEGFVPAPVPVPPVLEQQQIGDGEGGHETHLPFTAKAPVLSPVPSPVPWYPPHSKVQVLTLAPSSPSPSPYSPASRSLLSRLFTRTGTGSSGRPSISSSVEDINCSFNYVDNPWNSSFVGLNPPSSPASPTALSIVDMVTYLLDENRQLREALFLSQTYENSELQFRIQRRPAALLKLNHSAVAMYEVEMARLVKENSCLRDLAEGEGEGDTDESTNNNNTSTVLIDAQTLARGRLAREKLKYYMRMHLSSPSSSFPARKARAQTQTQAPSHSPNPNPGLTSLARCGGTETGADAEEEEDMNMSSHVLGPSSSPSSYSLDLDQALQGGGDDDDEAKLEPDWLVQVQTLNANTNADAVAAVNKHAYIAPPITSMNRNRNRHMMKVKAASLSLNIDTDIDTVMDIYTDMHIHEGTVEEEDIPDGWQELLGTCRDLQGGHVPIPLPIPDMWLVKPIPLPLPLSAPTIHTHAHVMNPDPNGTGARSAKGRVTVSSGGVLGRKAINASPDPDITVTVTVTVPRGNRASRVRQEKRKEKEKGTRE